MFRKLPHEGLAESSNFVVTSSLGIEVTATFATAHAQASQGILKDLFKTQELEDGQIDRRVKAETALVWSESRVELHTETPVNLEFTLIVFPDHSELDNTLWNRDDLQADFVLWVLLKEAAGLDGRDKLIVSLLELWLRRKVRHLCREFNLINLVSIIKN